MKLTAWVTIASLLMYIWVIYKVGRARHLYKVAAPATDGPPGFILAQRVLANTLEQIALFIPLLWLCGFFMNDLTAAVLGLIWVIGRVIYALGYYQDANKRHLGFNISSLAGIGLLIGAIAGLALH